MFVAIIIMIVSIIIQLATRPHQHKPVAATLGDVQIPTIDQGTPVAVVFGEVWCDNWMVLWYGDLRSTPIIKGSK